MAVSELKVVAVGIVASNKPLGSKVIDIFPNEWMTMRDGEIKSAPSTLQYSTTNAAGTAVKGASLGDQTIQATWIPSGSSNRLTAPDVRRGERVEILQVADSEQYYWRPTGLDDNLRKLETIIFGISATKDEKSTELNPDNMYWFEFSTHSKKLAFSSSKADGEPFQYQFFFDMAEGEFYLGDDVGNFVNLKSALKLIHAQNTDGTFFKLNQKDLQGYAPRDMQMKLGRDATFECGRNFTVKAATMVQLDGGGSVFTMIGGGTTLKTPQFAGST